MLEDDRSDLPDVGVPDVGGAASSASPAALPPALPAPARGRSFEQRASLSFKVLAAFAGVVTAIALPALATAEASPVVKVLTFAGAILLVVALIATATGLDRRRAWAVAAARPILVVMLVTGFGGTAVGLTQSRISLPLDALLATWALVGGPDVRPAPGLGRRAVAVVAAYLVAVVATTGAAPAFGPGGWFDVQPDDLVATAQADCGPTSTAPETIDITYRWSWRRAAPLPSGLDMIVVTWSGSDQVGGALYAIGDVTDGSTGVHAGMSGSPSTAMAQAIEAGTAGSWGEWGIQLEEQQFAADQVLVRLHRAADGSAPATPALVDARFTYIHQGVWQGGWASVQCAYGTG